MKIGITQRAMENKIWGKYDVLEQNYIKYFSKYNTDIVPIPNALDNVGNFIKSLGIKKIILSGGGDIDPNLYGRKRDRDNNNYMPDRDKMEIKLLNYASRKKMSVLGICRGMQLINVIFGGKLRSIRGENDKDEHLRAVHSVEIVDEKMKRILGKRFKVNSFHELYLLEEDLGKNLTVFAKTKDGTIEGFRHQTKSIYGIMWHPERNGLYSNKFNKKIINLFLK